MRFNYCQNHYRPGCLLLVGLVIWMGSCEAETITGVLYSNQRGPTGNSVGIIELAVGEQVYSIDYALSQTRRLRPICLEIGAIWTVEFETDMTMQRVKCSGKTDPLIHDAWRLVGTYLDRLVHKRATSDLISAQWKTTAAHREYSAKITRLDTSNYVYLGPGPRCLQVERVQPPTVVTLVAADCFLELGGDPIDLRFTVERDLSSKTLKIAEITTDP